jgi:hypothetical protein
MSPCAKKLECFYIYKYFQSSLIFAGMDHWKVLLLGMTRPLSAAIYRLK